MLQQKLQIRLAQKLILTPSLQQAIKLLPMTTIELVDMLNQEMVENPMLEEVPTEELQPTEASTQPEKTEDPPREANDTWDDADYEYFFGDYLDGGYRPPDSPRGQGASADREHARDVQFAHRPSDVAAVVEAGRRDGP